MAAAAFGNTVSDMMGIGSAWYVESWADKLGELQRIIHQQWLMSNV